MAAHAYYDRTLPTTEAKEALSKLRPTMDPRRSTKERVVYKLAGGGEAMVESAGSGTLRVRMYRGACPC